MDVLCLRILKARISQSNECNSVKMGYNGFIIDENFRIFKNQEIEEYLLSTIPHNLHLNS